MTRSEPLSPLKAEIRSFANRLEKLRRLYMTWLVIAVGIASFGVTFGLLYLNPEGINLRYTVIGGALVPSALIYVLLSRLYGARGSVKLIDSLCEASGFEHHPDGCFGMKVANKHKILPKHNKSILENGLLGIISGTEVALQEVVLTELRQDPDHEKKDKEFLRFWGLLVRIQLPRKLQGHSVIIPRATMKTFFSSDFSQYQEIKMNGTTRFEKVYEVVSLDAVEARLAINGAFKESFIAAGDALQAYWAEGSLKEGELMLAFQRFRPYISLPPLWKPVEEAALRHYAEELESIARIVRALQSNSQLGL